MRVLVVSSVVLYREGLCALLGARDDIDVVGVAATAPEAARVLLGMEHAADVILFDMTQPESAPAVRWLIDEVPDAKVFAVAVPASEREVVACAELGVVGLVTADASLNELVASLEATARGEMRCTPAVAAALLHRVTARARAAGRSPLPVLTQREGEIGVLIADGLSNKQIARRLSIALPTVRNHVHSILAKLGVHSRTEAAVLIRRAATVHASG
jgi:two-component system, NarL family, nitrate/nitrite response regulator NarL